MDRLNNENINSLNENARKSFREIARELKVSLSTIAKDKHLSGVYDITGDWDSLVIARFKDRRELNGFIKKVLSIDHVERSNTQLVLTIIKDEKRLLK